MPERIQRKRTKGYRLPEDAAYIGRPGRWGNPCTIGAWASVGPDWAAGQRTTMSTFLRTQDELVVFYRLGVKYGGLVLGDVRAENRRAVALPTPEQIRAGLGGRDLACWCALDQPCHGDELLRIANTPS